MTKLESLRQDAALLMAEIRPLTERLSHLKAQHAGVAQQVEAESRREAKITRVPLGVSGQQKQAKKPDFIAMFKNMTKLQQQQMFDNMKGAVG
jgi:hypothetical protein